MLLIGRAALALLLVGYAAPATAAICLPMTPCKFTISGKKGVYMQMQVTPAMLAANDRASETVVDGTRRLAESSINRGEFDGNGLDLPQTSAALQGMLERLRAGWPHRQPPPIRVRIVGSADYRAAARTDNTIIVPLGILMNATSDDEVAWIVAHEFSHLALAHFARDAKHAQRQKASDFILDGIQSAMDLSQRRIELSGGRGLTIRTVADADVAKASNLVWAHKDEVGLSLKLFNQYLSRRQEDQADAAGFDLLLAAKYSDAGYGQALDYLEADERRLAARVESLQSQLASQVKRAARQTLAKAEKGGDLNELGKSLMSDVKRNVGAVLLRKVTDIASQSSRPAVVRKRGLAAYRLAAHATAMPPEEATDWLTGVRGLPEFKDAKIAVVATGKARDRIAVSDAPGALRELDAALTTRYRSAPLVANTAAKAFDVSGDVANADKWYDIAARVPAPPAQPRITATKKKGRKAKATVAPPPPPVAVPIDPFLTQNIQGFRDNVEFLTARRNYPKALRVVAEAKTRLGDDDAFLPFLVRIYTQTRQTEALTAVVARCSQLSDERLRNDCALALYDPAQLDKLDQLPPADRDRLFIEMERKREQKKRSSFWDGLETMLKAPSE